MEEVFMDFDDDDNPVISVKGVKGRGCKDLTADLERKLGTVVKETKTKEYNEVQRGDNRGTPNRRG